VPHPADGGLGDEVDRGESVEVRIHDRIVLESEQDP
jgi:hypothetical protein